MRSEVSASLQEWNEIQFNGTYYAPPKVGEPGKEPDADTAYTFAYKRPPKPRALRIYECHVGMSSQVGSCPDAAVLAMWQRLTWLAACQPEAEDSSCYQAAGC